MSKKKIIIADDDPAICESMTMILEDAGYNVTTTNGHQLIDYTNSMSPDLILLDIWMSGIDGRDICRYLKKQESTKNIPIIMISANRDVNEMAKLCGAEGFIEKPFNIRDLFSVVKKYIDN
ncbi:MAG TPA: response regulator [Candidatus Saccharimonadales bacterium]|nr:response regulator [Candidatus Saccharimonadales bacterium]